MMSVSFPSEKAIEDYVYAKIAQTDVCPISGSQVDLCLRQHEVKGYGITDLIKISADVWSIDVTILELKNEILKESHLSQLSRYMAGIRRQLRRYEKRSSRVITVRGELAGPVDADANEMVFLLDQLSCISIYKLSLSMDDGFKSEEISGGWFKKSENLKAAKPIARHLFNAGLLDLPQKSNVMELNFSGRGVD